MSQPRIHFSPTSNQGVKACSQRRAKVSTKPHLSRFPLSLCFYHCKSERGKKFGVGGLTIWLNNSLKFLQPWQAAKYWLFPTRNKLEGQSISDKCKKYSPWKEYLNMLDWIYLLFQSFWKPSWRIQMLWFLGALTAKVSCTPCPCWGGSSTRARGSRNPQLSILLLWVVGPAPIGAWLIHHTMCFDTALDDKDIASRIVIQIQLQQSPS